MAGATRRALLAAFLLPGFGRPAAAQHAGAAELEQLRAELQAGEYRRALTLASHIAGGHPEVPAGGALYAWLLHFGGQARFALRVLEQALQRQPEDTLLLQVRQRLRQPWPLADAALRGAGLAPQASGIQAAAGSRSAGSALLAADGARAYAPAALLAGARTLWLRDGLGRTVQGSAGRTLDGGVVELALAPALPAPADFETATRAPFAGSPGVTVEYAPAAEAAPSWPLLRAGFFGREGRLGLDVPPGPRGGPVFDLAGRVQGIALPAADGADRLLPAAAFLPPTPPAEARPARLPQDALYERALRVALQLVLPA